MGVSGVGIRQRLMALVIALRAIGSKSSRSQRRFYCLPRYFATADTVILSRCDRLNAAAVVAARAVFSAAAQVALSMIIQRANPRSPTDATCPFFLF